MKMNMEKRNVSYLRAKAVSVLFNEFLELEGLDYILGFVEKKKLKRAKKIVSKFLNISLVSVLRYERTARRYGIYMADHKTIPRDLKYPDKTRAMISLLYNNFKFTEIAKLVGIKEASVKRFYKRHEIKK